MTKLRASVSVNLLILALLLVILVGALTLFDAAGASKDVLSDPLSMFILGVPYFAVWLFPVALIQIGLARLLAPSRAWALVAGCVGSVAVAVVLRLVASFDISAYLLATAALPTAFATVMWLSPRALPRRRLGALSFVATVIVAGIVLS